METIRAMAERAGEPVYGFALLLTGGLPADQEKRHDLQAKIMQGIETALDPLLKEGLCLGSLSLRAEPAERYIEMGLPNAE